MKKISKELKEKLNKAIQDADTLFCIVGKTNPSNPDKFMCDVFVHGRRIEIIQFILEVMSDELGVDVDSLSELWIAIKKRRAENNTSNV